MWLEGQHKGIVAQLSALDSENVLFLDKICVKDTDLVFYLVAFREQILEELPSWNLVLKSQL